MQGWRNTEMPMEMTDSGWALDGAYEALVESLVDERLAIELHRRMLRARIGKMLGRG